MARRNRRSILVPLLLANSALLALLVISCQNKAASEIKPTASRAVAVAGARVLRLDEQTAALTGTGNVKATGALRIEGTGRFAAIANNDILAVNGLPYGVGQIVRSEAVVHFIIEGPDLFAELSGEPVNLLINGSGELSPDVEITTEVLD